MTGKNAHGRNERNNKCDEGKKNEAIAIGARWHSITIAKFENIS
jgi:hypothetical protein